MRKTTLLWVVPAALCAVVALVYGQPRPGRPGPVPRPVVPGPGVPCGPAVQPTRLQIEFYQLTCAENALAELDVRRLCEQERTIAAVLNRLKALGEARLVTRADTVLDLAQENQLTEGTRLPVVQDVNVNKEGRTTPSISYQEVGMRASLSGSWEETDPGDTAIVRCRIELSSLGKTGVSASQGVTLPEFRQWKIDQTIGLKSGRPVMLMSNSQVSPSDEQRRISATLMRLTVTRLGTLAESQPAPQG